MNAVKVNINIKSNHNNKNRFPIHVFFCHPKHLNALRPAQRQIDIKELFCCINSHSQNLIMHLSVRNWCLFQGFLRKHFICVCLSVRFLSSLFLCIFAHKFPAKQFQQIILYNGLLVKNGSFLAFPHFHSLLPTLVGKTLAKSDVKMFSVL